MKGACMSIEMRGAANWSEQRVNELNEQVKVPTYARESPPQRPFVFYAITGEQRRGHSTSIPPPLFSLTLDTLDVATNLVKFISNCLLPQPSHASNHATMPPKLDATDSGLDGLHEKKTGSQICVKQP